MTAAALPPDTQPFALELHGLLKQIDPAQWKPELEERIRARLRDLRAALARLIESLDPRGPFAAIRAALDEANGVLDGQLPAPGLDGRDARRAWSAFRKALTHAYERLGKSLETWDIHVPSLRPTNYARNVFHMVGATSASLVLWSVPDQGTLVLLIAAIATWAWTVETLRRSWKGLNTVIMKVFAPVAHPHEWHRVNSATWYATALLILALLDIPVASMVALLVLGFGDPMAAIIGRRFGRTKLVNGRSLEGTLAFVAVGGIVATGALHLAWPSLGWTAALAAAFAGAVGGSIAELVSRRIDDNFSIPITAAAMATLALHALGLDA